MKTKLTILSLLAAAAFGQSNTVGTTTLSAAVATSDSVITVAFATGISSDPQTVLFVDREMMTVRSVSGTSITVNRGRGGTATFAHASGATVYRGRPEWFYSYNPAGTCTLTSLFAHPWVNLRTSEVWECDSSLWVRQRYHGVAVSGTGQYVANVGPDIYQAVTVTTLSTVGNATLTAAQLIGRLILRDPNGGARTDTLPTAALLVAAIPNAVVGATLEFTIRNTADAAETITVASGTGGTDSGTMTIAQSNSKRFLIRLDNVTAASEAYTAYSLGTIVH